MQSIFTCSVVDIPLDSKLPCLILQFCLADLHDMLVMGISHTRLFYLKENQEAEVTWH
jgi:hypothetical protein